MRVAKAGRLVRAALAGAVAWTAMEYALHRFAMHVPRGQGLASREHLQHHADVHYFSPTSKKLISAASTTALVLPGAWWAVGRDRALAFTAGMIATYGAYEVAHRRIHTHAPRTRYGRWARRSHFHHHFARPMRNFGVTSPIWDRVLGTYDVPGVVRVPRRMAPVWLLDERGEVHPELAADYEVVGPDRGDREADREAAFANVPPEPAPAG